MTGGEEQQQGEIRDRKQCAESMGVQINKDPFNTCLLENEPCLSPTLVTARLCKLLVRISTKQDLAKTLIAVIQPNESVTNRHLVLSAKCRQTN